MSGSFFDSAALEWPIGEREIIIIEYSISDESIVRTIEMLRAEKQGHKIFWDSICFANVVIKNDVNSVKIVRLDDAPFFHLMESLKYFLDENKKEKYARADLSCIDQFYSFRIEKENLFLLLSKFARWEKWEPVKIRHEGMEKEIQLVCRQFLQDYSKRCPILLNYSQINLIKSHFDI